MSTIQLDFAAKKRFNLSYVDEKGEANNEVFVIHRAPLSVHERFLAFLLEQYAGKFPLWLAPVQVAVLPISEKHVAYAMEIDTALKKEGVRVETNANPERIGKKIRVSTLQKVPYMIIIGDKEIEQKNLSVRMRDGKDLGAVSLLNFINTLKTTIENHS